MALPKNRPLNVIRVYAHMADCSTAGSAFTVAPARGKIINMGSVIHGAVASADNAITSKISGTAITGGGWTISYSGSAGGDVDTAVPTAANNVVEGDSIEFISDGAGGNTVPTTFFADIRVS